MTRSYDCGVYVCLGIGRALAYLEQGGGLATEAEVQDMLEVRDLLETHRYSGCLSSPDLLQFVSAGLSESAASQARKDLLQLAQRLAAEQGRIMPG